MKSCVYDHSVDRRHCKVKFVTPFWFLNNCNCHLLHDIDNLWKMVFKLKRVFGEFIGNFSVKDHILFENQGFSRYSKYVTIINSCRSEPEEFISCSIMEL